MPLNVRMLKPGRMEKKYAHLRCLRPKHWQGLGADGQTVKNLRPCGKTATCRECDLYEAEVHLERAYRGRPAQLVTVSGFGGPDSTIAQTVGDAKAYRTRQEDRIRKNSGIHPLDQKAITGERRKFLTALRIGADDYRASLTLILAAPLSDKQLERERARAESAGLIFTVVNRPTRLDLERIAPASLTVAMEGVGKTAKTNTWTSSGWPEWIDLPTTYQFSDGRDLANGEEFAPDAIERKQWRREHRQTWDKTATLRGNVHRREEHAERNAQLWVSACLDLNLETIQDIGHAATVRQCESILAATDYTGPVALLRDVAAYLEGRKEWRKAYRPVLAVLGL